MILRFVLITLLFLSACTSGFMPFHATAAETHFRISVDSPPSHITNTTVQTFLQRLETATDGEVVGTLFGSGQLYAARDEPKAVARGDIEMSVTVNTWLSAFSPNYAVFDLPLFSGHPMTRINRLVDGPLGNRLAGGLEARLGVIVPGRSLLLGFANTFGAGKTIKSFSDFQGMRIRVPGGVGFNARYRALGAVAISIPFSDVPLALSQGSVDGLLTTNETVRSSKIYEAGITSVFIDEASVLYITPLVNGRFWDRLNPKHRKAFAEAWESVIDEEREEAVQRQAAACAANARQGVKVYEPTVEELQTINARLWALVPDMAAEVDIDPAIIELAWSELERPK